jgi:hypothetical protein
MSSSGSPRRNSSSDLHLIPAGAQHESTFPASHLPRAPAPTPALCLIWPRRHYPSSLRPLPANSVRLVSLRSRPTTATHRRQQHLHGPSLPAQPHTKPIDHAQWRGGFLQVAVSEAPAHSVLNPQIFAHGRSRYSPKTSRYQSSMSASAMVGSSTFFKFGDIRRLFSSQCLNWIDARCPPRRDQAGHHCDGHQHRRCARKRRRIERLGSIEH